MMDWKKTFRGRGVGAAACVPVAADALPVVAVLQLMFLFCVVAALQLMIVSTH
jgi:hypothetical protein